MIWWLALACTGDGTTDTTAGDADPSDAPGDADTDADADSDSDTDADADADPPETGDTGPLVDCAALPAPPIPSVRLTGPPASEDFAFDDAGLMISHSGSALVKSEYPPGTVTPWAPTDGSGGGPASMRMLSTGDLVYHNVDTSTLYRIDPAGIPTVVYSGFAYASGIEIHPGTDGVYVVDLLGIHLIDPFTFDRELYLQSAQWSSPNGITLTEDHLTLLISSRNGIWQIPIDASGAPTGPETLWADAPAGAGELLGMGTDLCGNVYVTGSEGGFSKVWRYAAGGALPPEVLLERAGGWLSNLQWGSGLGGWDTHKLYVVDRQATNPGYDELDIAVPEKPR